VQAPATPALAGVFGLVVVAGICILIIATMVFGVVIATTYTACFFCERRGDSRKQRVTAISRRGSSVLSPTIATTTTGAVHDLCWNVTGVSTMWAMFLNARAFHKNLSNWDVSNVMNMRSMFANAQAFEQNLSNWDVSNVMDMRFMFLGATALDQTLCWDLNESVFTRGMFCNTERMRNAVSTFQRQYANTNLAC
jgi:surface protein